MTAWIMTNSKGVPYTRNFYDLMTGFEELGEEIKFYNASDVFSDNIPAEEHNIVVGHINQCRAQVKKVCGKDIPNLDFPEELTSFLKRKVTKTTLGEIYKKVTITGEIDPIFIKSVDQKYITGFVCKGFSDYSKNCGGIDYSTEIYASEVVNFKSEYRCYIHRHEIIDCRRYKGDWCIAPSKETLNEIMYSLRNANMPIAYSIDVGIIESGETILVECNDGFALGNYGLHVRKYAEMHRDRWYQMIRK